MRKITKALTIILAISGASLSASAQDIHFSQFYESPLNLNPALCGVFNGQIYGSLNYRNQWTSVMGSGAGFNTMGATFELHNVNKKWTKAYLSPGLSFFNDKSGDAQIGITEVCFSLASGVYLGQKSVLAGGLQGGWSQHSINLTGLKWDEQYINGEYDPNAATGETSTGSSFSYVDFAAGLTYSYGTGQTTLSANNQFKFNIGAAAYHLNQPKMSYYGEGGPGTSLYMRYVLHGFMEYGIQNSNIALVPGFVFFQQGPAQEVNLGIKFRYLIKQESKYTGINKGSALDLGGYYRMGDAFVILTQMEFANFAVGFSYDFNTSGLTTASSGKGGFEISLRFINPNPFMANTTSGDNHSMF